LEGGGSRPGIDPGRVPVDLFIVSVIPAGWEETNPSTEGEQRAILIWWRLKGQTATAAITVT
jgi:hypothetical protein